MPQSLREIAVEKANETQAENVNYALIVLGSSNSGKSTLISRWLGRHTVNSGKRTPGLEYYWGRKSNSICHVWELVGSNTIMESLLKIVLRSDKAVQPAAVVSLDLSKPNCLWKTVQSSFNALKPYLPMKIAIIGSKYDMFQNIDPEIKKNVCKFLRGINLIYTGTLVFYSSEISTLTRRTGEILNVLAWNASISKISPIKDHNSPLFIPSEFDKWEDIGFGESTLNQLGQIYCSRIKQIDSE